MNRVDVALGLFQRGGRYFLQRRDPAAALLGVSTKKPRNRLGLFVGGQERAGTDGMGT